METQSTETNFVILDLPVRFTAAEMHQLNLAVAKAIRRETVTNSGLPSTDLVTAIERARQLVKLHADRAKAFGSDLFSDPAWALLLDLFIAEGSSKRVSVSSACLGSGAPSTTALRHLATLERNGWVERSASAEDQRVIYVRLSESAVDTMLRLFASP